MKTKTKREKRTEARARNRRNQRKSHIRKIEDQRAIETILLEVGA